MPLDFTPLDSIQEEHEQERVAQCSHSLQILALLVEFSPECTGACFNVEMRAGGSCTGLEKRALVHSDVASGQLAFDPARKRTCTCTPTSRRACRSALCGIDDLPRGNLM